MGGEIEVVVAREMRKIREIRGVKGVSEKKGNLDVVCLFYSCFVSLLFLLFIILFAFELMQSEVNVCV